MSGDPVGEGHDLRFAAISATTTSGDNTIVAADTAGRKIKVVAYTLVAAAATSVTWKSASTALSGAMPFAANGGASVNGTATLPVIQTNANEALVLTLGAGAVYGHIAYILEA